MLGKNLKTGHDCFFSHPFQFRIHNHPIIQCYITYADEKVLLKLPKNQSVFLHSVFTVIYVNKK
jgi:hypothetical protein